MMTSVLSILSELVSDNARLNVKICKSLKELFISFSLAFASY